MKAWGLPKHMAVIPQKIRGKCNNMFFYRALVTPSGYIWSGTNRREKVQSKNYKILYEVEVRKPLKKTV